MQPENKKLQRWDSKDYARTAAIFLINIIIVALIIFFSGFVGKAQPLNVYISQNLKSVPYLLSVTLLLAIIIYLYFYFEHRDFLIVGKNIFLVFAILITGLIASFLAGKYISIYARPFALCALLALMLIGRKEAVFINFLQCLLLFILDTFLNARNSYTSLILGFIGGMTAIYAVSGSRSRLKVLFSGVVISLPLVFAALFIELGGDNSFAAALWSLIAGVLSAVIFMAVLPVFEAVFNIVTSYRLHELTKHDQRLIKLLKEKAPGTFNHSIFVANMAEVCATALGEDANLARAAAYYHDIGKINHPECFAENSSGKTNPHNEYTPELSTDIIRAHANDGALLIKKYRLPKILGDICKQHHGTMPIKFFYAKAKKMTEGELNVEEFSYYGPTPQTKIAAIIMLCDACEARARTITNRTYENVEKAVNDIFEERMSFEQFIECEITVAELEIIRKAIIDTLTGIYHDRVKYPRFKLKKEKE